MEYTVKTAKGSDLKITIETDSAGDTFCVVTLPNADVMYCGCLDNILHPFRVDGVDGKVFGLRLAKDKEAAKITMGPAKALAALALDQKDILQKIKAEFAAKEAAELERRIPGFAALKRAQFDEDQYACAMEAWMDAGADTSRPTSPANDSAALSAQYPLAAAYLAAEQASCADNYKLVSAGQQAQKLLWERGEQAIPESVELLKNWADDAQWD